MMLTFCGPSLSPSPKPKATSPTAVPSSPTFPTSGTQSTLAINPAPDTRRPKKRGAEKQEAGSQPKKKPKVSEVDTTEFRKRLDELGLLSRVTNLPSSKRSNFWRSSRVTQSPERVLSSLENKETKAKEVQEAKARAVQEAKEAKAKAEQEAKEAKAKAEQEAKEAKAKAEQEAKEAEWQKLQLLKAQIPEDLFTKFDKSDPKKAVEFVKAVAEAQPLKWEATDLALVTTDHFGPRQLYARDRLRELPRIQPHEIEHYINLVHGKFESAAKKITQAWRQYKLKKSLPRIFLPPGEF